MTLDEVVVFFEELEDPRSSINRRHPLASVTVIAVLAGTAGPTAIAGWAELKQDLLIQLLDLHHGIPAASDAAWRALDLSGAGVCSSATTSRTSL